MLSNDSLNDLSAVFNFFKQFADHALTDDNVKLVVQKSDHVILINDESLTEKVKKLLSMIFTQKSRFKVSIYQLYQTQMSHCWNEDVFYTYD